jgi:hypothetical protein
VLYADRERGAAHPSDPAAINWAAAHQVSIFFPFSVYNSVLKSNVFLFLKFVQNVLYIDLMNVRFYFLRKSKIVQISKF